jgi:hypothetical protein
MGLTLLLVKLVISIVVVFLDLSAFFVLVQLLVPNPGNRWLCAIQQAGQTLVTQWQGVFSRVWQWLGVCVSERLSLAISLVCLMFIRGVVEILTFGLRGN